MEFDRKACNRSVRNVLSDPVTRVESIASVARLWNASGYQYAVAHGVEGFPESLGRDVDVVMRSRDIATALDEARQSLTAAGWRVVEPPRLWGRRLVAVDPCASQMLELHVHSRLRWRTVVVAEGASPTARHGPFAIDPWIAWAKRVLLPLLAGDAERVLTRGEEAALAPGAEAQVAAQLAALFGRRLGRRILEHAEAEDAPGLVALGGQARRAATARALVSRPLLSLVWPFTALGRRILMPFAPCAPVVALVGPDGVGKSTAIKGLRSLAADWVFLDLVERHWRPGLLPRLGVFAGRSAPAAGVATPPRREAGRLRWVRVAYYALDVWLGSWARDRPAVARQKLVVYDRCFLDMAVDPLRYGLGSGRAILALWKLLPRPDRVIVLSGDPSVVWKRKGEIPLPEIEAQFASWGLLAAQGYVDAIIDAGSPPDQVAERIGAIVLEAFLELNEAGR